MNRTFDGGATLMGGEYIDDLPARGENLEHLAMIDGSHKREERRSGRTAAR